MGIVMSEVVLDSMTFKGEELGGQGKIVEIEKTVAKKRRQALVVIEDATGVRYQTILDFVFSVGEAEPLIAVSEASEVV